MKVLREFQTIGEGAAVTHRVGTDFDPKKHNITDKSIGALVAGGFIEEAKPAVKEVK